MTCYKLSNILIELLKQDIVKLTSLLAKSSKWMWDVCVLFHMGNSWSRGMLLFDQITHIPVVINMWQFEFYM